MLNRVMVFPLCVLDFAAASVAAPVTSCVDAEPKWMLLLYAARHEVPAIQVADTVSRETSVRPDDAEVMMEYFDFAQFATVPRTGCLIDLPGNRSRTQKLDLVLSLGGKAQQFTGASVRWRRDEYDHRAA